MTRFLHFGCWNEFGCKTDTDLKKTMDKLKIHIRDNDIDFVVVAGDNYYLTKNDKVKPKIKKFETDLFLSGIKCLLDALKKESEKKIEKYILLGNHEYEDIKNIDEEIEKSIDEELGKPDKIEFFNEDNLFFERRTWHTENGDLIKLLVSDDPTFGKQPKVTKALQEQLDEAVAEENYEKAAQAVKDGMDKKKTAVTYSPKVYYISKLVNDVATPNNNQYQSNDPKKRLKN